MEKECFVLGLVLILLIPFVIAEDFSPEVQAAYTCLEDAMGDNCASASTLEINASISPD